jgi:hypothetical protein
MSEPVTADREAGARVSDAMQGAYFRGVLADKRTHLNAELGGAQNRQKALVAAGDRFEAHKLQRHVRKLEYELFQLNRLIDGLDRRFTDAWASISRAAE